MGLKVLHTADLHFGMENYGRVDPATGLNQRLIDFRNGFARALDHALERDVDLVLIAGDCFRSRDPSATHQREFAACLRKVLERRIPVVIVLGNHDTPNAIGRAHALAVYGSLGVPRLTLFEKPGLKVIDTFHGPLQIAALPYVTRSFLLDKEAFRGLSLEEVNRQIADKCANIVQDLAERADPNLPTILVYHGSVGGAIFGSERSVMIGHDLVIPYGALDVRRAGGRPAWDYVALGHLHRHQDLNEGGQPPVVYPGSIERVDFGEEREEKGFCWVDIERGRATYEFVRLPARPFVTLRLDCTGGRATPVEALEAALAARAAEVAGTRAAGLGGTGAAGAGGDGRRPGSAGPSGARGEPQAPGGGAGGEAGAIEAGSTAQVAHPARSSRDADGGSRGTGGASGQPSARSPAGGGWPAPADSGLHDAVVRVIVKVSPGGEGLDERPLRARLAQAGVYYVAGIAREVEGEASRSRDSQLTERLGPMEAVERYIAAQADLAQRREVLLAATRELLRELEEGRR